MDIYILYYAHERQQYFVLLGGEWIEEFDGDYYGDHIYSFYCRSGKMRICLLQCKSYDIRASSGENFNAEI